MGCPPSVTGADVVRRLTAVSFQEHVQKVFQKQESMQEMFHRRQASLKKLAAKQTRPVQPVAPRPEALTKSPCPSPGTECPTGAMQGVPPPASSLPSRRPSQWLAGYIPELAARRLGFSWTPPRVFAVPHPWLILGWAVDWVV